MQLRWLVVLVPLLALPSSLHSQERSDDAWARYDAEKKSEFAAAGLEFMVPVLGHAYVGDARKGLTPALTSAAGLTLAIVGTQVGCNDEFLGECIEEGNVALVWVGVLGYLGGRIWGIVSALEEAQEHNASLKRQLNLSVQPTSDGEVTALLNYTFAF